MDPNLPLNRYFDDKNAGNRYEMPGTPNSVRKINSKDSLNNKVLPRLTSAGKKPQLPPIPNKDNIAMLQQRIMLKNGIDINPGQKNMFKKLNDENKDSSNFGSQVRRDSSRDRINSSPKPKNSQEDKYGMDNLLDQWKNNLSKGEYDNKYQVKDIYGNLKAIEKSIERSPNSRTGKIQFDYDKKMELQAKKQADKNAINAPPGAANKLFENMNKMLDSYKISLEKKIKIIEEQNQKIETLENENTILREKCIGKNEESAFDIVTKENLALKKEVEEIQGFLLDYGLKWVGAGRKPEGNLDVLQLNEQLDAQKNNKPLYHHHQPKEVDMGVLARRVEELNYMILKESGDEIVVNKDGHAQFKKRQPLPLAFFKNGIILKGFPFFPYGTKDTVNLLADILDGYFPKQLEKSFPDGTLLKIIDKLDDVYSANKSNVDKIFGPDEKELADLKPMTKNEFQKKLPEKVIKNGRIVEIRNAINNKMNPNDKASEEFDENFKNFETDEQGNVIIETAARSRMKSDKDFDQSSLVKLKIRLEFSGKNIIAYMFSTDNIGQVYNWIKPYSESVAKGKDFKIVNNWPRKEIEKSDPRTLKELNLYPNSALLLQTVE